MEKSIEKEPSAGYRSVIPGDCPDPSRDGCVWLFHSDDGAPELKKGHYFKLKKGGSWSPPVGPHDTRIRAWSAAYKMYDDREPGVEIDRETSYHLTELTRDALLPLSVTLGLEVVVAPAVWNTDEGRITNLVQWTTKR